MLIALLSFVPALAATAPAADATAPQPQAELRQMLRITWQRGPDLPQGFQDSQGGFVGSKLITVGGFCSGFEIESKPGRYPRGFLKKAWALDLAHPGEGWETLPDFPGAARQGMAGAALGGAVYCWGGFSYPFPYCYRDGHRLVTNDGGWRWERLPRLPWPVAGAGACVIGTKIYLCGGADYDGERYFYTTSDRRGRNPRLGARLLVFDTADAAGGWLQLADCPGTPRWVHAMAAVGGKIYVIGGATGDVQPYGYCTVVDNWAYAPARNEWTRIRDLPVASANFPTGNIVYGGRYILLVGGFQYTKVMNPDGTVRDPYGTPHKFYPDKGYYSDVFVFDTKTGLFGTATPLPLNNNGPMTQVRGDEVFLIGGETNGAVIDGVVYAHHPDLFLRAKIEEVDWE